MAAIERLDMLLNDSMYGILFRDINMKRTFIDQHFSRMLNALFAESSSTPARTITSPPPTRSNKAPAVLASQFINEEFAHRAGIARRTDRPGRRVRDRSPTSQDGFLHQVAQAQLARQIFPKAPLKYMPPTKHMTGDIFKGHLIDAMFNLTSVMTKQTIHLCGMLTEAIHTPFLADRALSIENAHYVMNTARHFGDEIAFKPGGRVEIARAASAGRGGETVAPRRGSRLDARYRKRAYLPTFPSPGRRPRFRRRFRTRRRLLESIRRGVEQPRGLRVILNLSRGPPNSPRVG